MIRILITLFLILLSAPSYALQTINITRGNADPIPIAINTFETDSAADASIAKDVLEVITNDLKSSGLFKPISHAAFIEVKTGIGHKPLFASWRQIDATILVNGKVSRLPSGDIEISFMLWDIVAEKDIAGEVFECSHKLWRRVAHKISDKIYERVTGDKGYFDTKVAYISETGTAKKKIKRLAMMDYDGANHVFLTKGDDLVLTPRFSPKADKILYLSYHNRKARVHMRDLKSGKDSVVGQFTGMSFAPRFSPDGTKALMSIAKDGATNIVEIDLNTMKVKHLTRSISDINTSPGYSPDGQKIVFNSDRNGTRQLYVMNVDGSGVERISFGGGIYAAPVWSPRGDYIACTKKDGEFMIAVLRPDGSGERTIASGYLTESPTWAPNGRVLAFARATRPTKNSQSKSKIHVIDLTGYNEHELKTPKDASDAEWSRQLD